MPHDNASDIVRGGHRLDPGARPAPGQPGTLGEQLRAVAIFHLTDPEVRRTDPATCWAMARRLSMPHAMRGAT